MRSETTPWRPYYKTDISGDCMVHPCAVCHGRSERYLTNTYYCPIHFDLAMRRDLVCHRMVTEATQPELEEIFRKQPDFWIHAKWICETEGREYSPDYSWQKCEVPQWMQDRYFLPHVEDKNV